MAITPNNGKNIITRTGQKFTISLDSNPTTGYTWFPRFNRMIIKLLSHDFHPSSRTALGGPGNEVFTFQAVSQGTDEVKMFYKRNWEKRFLAKKKFAVNVI